MGPGGWGGCASENTRLQGLSPTPRPAELLQRQPVGELHTPLQGQGCCTLDRTKLRAKLLWLDLNPEPLWFVVAIVVLFYFLLFFQTGNSLGTQSKQRAPCGGNRDRGMELLGQIHHPGFKWGLRVKKKKRRPNKELLVT